MPRRSRLISFAIAFAFAQVSLASAQKKSIVVASTTSTEDPGLFDFILPLFKQKTGIDVKVVARGTEQALDMARRGDADVVFVHAKEAEEKFVAEGHGVKRNSVMYNDFVIIGRRATPPALRGQGTSSLRCSPLRPSVCSSSRGAITPAPRLSQC